MKERRIVVNARWLLKGKLDGIGWFSYQVLKRICRNHPEVHFVFLFDRDFHPDFVFSSNVTPLVIGPPARHAFLFYVWYQHSVKSILNKLKPDLFLSPDGMLSLGAKCPQLGVIHDINFHHHPKDIPFWAGKFYNRYFPKYAHSAARLVTVSEYSKQDIVNTYFVPEDKIDVVYNGINENYFPLSPEEIKAIQVKYTGGAPYFIFVGSMHPRKNISRLLQAFEKFKSETGAPHKLLLCGSHFWGKDQLESVLSKMVFRLDVIFTGRVPDDILPKLMASAFALTFVPYFEGFGIPLIEAMQCEVPIISSNVTSMPEVTGDAALLVNPLSVEEIAGAMIFLWKDDGMRQLLIEKGRKQKEKYNWDLSAEKLWMAMEKAMLPV